MAASDWGFCKDCEWWQIDPGAHSADNTMGGIVKLLGMIVSPGNSRHFSDAMSADPTLRQPTPYP